MPHADIELLHQDLWIRFKEELHVRLFSRPIKRAFKRSYLIARKRSPFDELVRRKRFLNTLCHSRQCRRDQF